MEERRSARSPQPVQSGITEARIWPSVLLGCLLLFSAACCHPAAAEGLPSLPAASVSASLGFTPFSPFGIALTRDGRYAYLSFDVSAFVIKVRLSDMSVVAGADFTRYFPLRCANIVLDASETKLFLYRSHPRETACTGCRHLAGDPNHRRILPRPLTIGSLPLGTILVPDERTWVAAQYRHPGAHRARHFRRIHFHSGKRYRSRHLVCRQVAAGGKRGDRDV